MSEVVIVDYKMGNLGSIKNMLKKIGHEARITSNPAEILAAKKLILPGVGRFDRAMENLRSMHLLEPLNQVFKRGDTPILGICLGMQLMVSQSEEGGVEGLGWFSGKVKQFRFPEDKTLRVPHMGWNEVEIAKTEPLFKGLEDEARFYFVHSYAVELDGRDAVAATTDYGRQFVSSLGGGRVWGVQFHPEKSHRFGMTLLKNFVEGVS